MQEEQAWRMIDGRDRSAARPTAWGVVKWGRCVRMRVVHAVARGGQDIGILLRVMGEPRNLPYHALERDVLSSLRCCRPVIFQKPTPERTDLPGGQAPA